MKLKRADRKDWWRVTKNRFVMLPVESAMFTGYVTLYCIDAVREPLQAKSVGQDVCLADEGYLWMQHFPQGTRYAITSIFNAQHELISWYIDICKRHYLDKNGILWYEDLYLDLDVSPAGEFVLLDADELDEALRQGQISSLDYELAWREANGLMSAIEEDMFPLLWHCEAYKDQLLALLKEN